MCVCVCVFGGRTQRRPNPKPKPNPDPNPNPDPDPNPNPDPDPDPNPNRNQVQQQSVPEEFQPLVMSSQWATLWLADVISLTEIEEELKQKWGPRSHPAPIYGIQVSEI